MTEYPPIYQTGVSLTRSLPAMESNYGNQTVELSVLQNTELLDVDLGNLNLSDTALTDMLTFWFVFGSKWFRFGLPEFKLDPIITTKTNKYAYFKLESNNIYKLFLRNNGIDKRVYLPKNLKIANYIGVIKELSDYTFYLSMDPGTRAITGDYDLPVIMESNSLAIASSKDSKLNNLRIKEILFGEEATPPIKLTNLVKSVIGGGSIKSPPPLPPPPFIGGQCAVSYNVTYTFRLLGTAQGSGGSAVSTNTAQGPLDYFAFEPRPGVYAQTWWLVLKTRGAAQNVELDVGLRTSAWEVDTVSLTRTDGLPDDCGNLPGYLQP
jgi:hypothetical protein